MTDPSTRTCPECGKKCYPSRKIAKKAARQLRNLGRMNAYRCGPSWHLGHPRRNVVRGLEGRESYTQEPTRQ